MTRSQQKDNFLLSGEISTAFTKGSNYDGMKLICNQIWKIIRKLGNNNLSSIELGSKNILNNHVKEFYAFPKACYLIESGGIESFKAKSSLHYYKLNNC